MKFLRSLCTSSQFPAVLVLAVGLLATVFAQSDPRVNEARLLKFVQYSLTLPLLSYTVFYTIFVAFLGDRLRLLPIASIVAIAVGLAVGTMATFAVDLRNLEVPCSGEACYENRLAAWLAGIVTGVPASMVVLILSKLFRLAAKPN